MRGAYKTKYIDFRGFEMKISTQAEKGVRVMGTLALFLYQIKNTDRFKTRISLIYNHDRIIQLSIEGEM